MNGKIYRSDGSVLPAPAVGSGQTYDTPRCKHCSDPLDEQGRDLVTGETFCGANPDNDKHEPEEG